MARHGTLRASVLRGRWTTPNHCPQASSALLPDSDAFACLGARERKEKQVADGSNARYLSYRLKSEYSISERRALLIEYRALVAKIAKAHGRNLSVQALSHVVEDVLNTFSGWLEVGGSFKTVMNARLDAHTLRSLLRCDLSVNLLKVHMRSLHVLDAFVQIAKGEPPDWLNEILNE